MSDLLERAPSFDMYPQGNIEAFQEPFGVESARSLADVVDLTVEMGKIDTASNKASVDDAGNGDDVACIDD